MGKFEMKDYGLEYVQRLGDDEGRRRFIGNFIKYLLVRDELDGMTVQEIVDRTNEVTELDIKRYEIEEHLERIDPMNDDVFRWEERDNGKPGRNPQELVVKT